MADPFLVPATLTAGDSWAFSAPAAFVSHPPASWAATLALRPQGGGAGFDLTGTPGAGAWTFGRGASLSASVEPGAWTWALIARAAFADRREALASGRVAILPDPAGEGDRRSSAERILAAITATLEGRATKDADAYTIEGRSITRTPVPDLLRLRDVYARQVKAERGGGVLSYRRARFK